MTEPTPSPADSNRVTVLVVDDALVDRRVTGALLERELGWRVVYAENGRAALSVVEQESPRIILTDLHMPEMDGLQLVVAVRKKHPLIPVVLMTAYGNEEIAIRALQKGASSYVPKKDLERDLATTLEQVLAASQVERRQQQLMERLTRGELHFTLENDRTLVAPLVSHVQQYLARLGLCDQTGVIRVGVALEESLLNAMYHGNLEVSSDLRQQGEDPFHRLIDERRQQAPYRDRRVFIALRFSSTEVASVIRDEGPGFDPGKLPDPTDPSNLERVGGRGLLLIRTFMDEVTFNARGNEISLIKRCEAPPARG